MLKDKSATIVQIAADFNTKQKKHKQSFSMIRLNPVVVDHTLEVSAD